MAFNGKTKELREKLLFKGVGKVKVFAVNPTKEELNKIYGESENDRDVSYVTTRDDGSKSTRIDFYVKPENYETINKITFWIDHNISPSQSGKYQFINDKLQDTWSESLEALTEKLNSNESMSWFSKKNLRKAYKGERELYVFLATLFNLDLEAGIESFDNFDAIVAGDVTEIKAAMSVFSENGTKDLMIKVLHGINDRGYQEIYNRKFANANQNRFNALVKEANGEYGAFKADWGNDVEFRVVTADEKPKTAEVVNSTASSLY